MAHETTSRTNPCKYVPTSCEPLLPKTAGQLVEDLGKVRKQLDECRGENVSLFEKVCWTGRVDWQGVPSDRDQEISCSPVEQLKVQCLNLEAELDVLPSCSLKVRYLERYSQQAAASGGRQVVVKVDEAGVRQAEVWGRGRCGERMNNFATAF